MGPLGGRPTYQVGRPTHGPYRLKSVMWQPPIGSQCRFKWYPAGIQVDERVAPLYKYEGRVSISWHGEIVEEILPQDVVHLHL